MEKNEKVSLITKPGAVTFFTWIALSAAIFFGAYSVKIYGLYNKKVSELNAVKSSERELSYRLELASVKIKDSVETLEWANVEIERLRKRNDDVLEKSANLRKLLYASVKKNQKSSKNSVVSETKSEQISSVEPKSLAYNAEDIKPELGKEILFPEIIAKEIENTPSFEEIVKKSSELNEKSKGIVAEVLTYNPNSKKVFINLGRSNAKIREGNRLAIWRNGKHVTDVRVAQVHTVTSTCEIISPVVDGVRAGDTAELIKISAY